MILCALHLSIWLSPCQSWEGFVWSCTDPRIPAFPRGYLRAMSCQCVPLKSSNALGEYHDDYSWRMLAQSAWQKIHEVPVEVVDLCMVHIRWVVAHQSKHRQSQRNWMDEDVIRPFLLSSWVSNETGKFVCLNGIYRIAPVMMRYISLSMYASCRNFQTTSRQNGGPNLGWSRVVAIQGLHATLLYSAVQEVFAAFL